jgi:hypothetical protein
VSADQKVFSAKYRLDGHDCEIVVVATDEAAAWQYIEDAHDTSIRRLGITELYPRKAA